MYFRDASGRGSGVIVMRGENRIYDFDEFVLRSINSVGYHRLKPFAHRFGWYAEFD